MAITDLIPFWRRRHEGAQPVRHRQADPFLHVQHEMNRLFAELLPDVSGGGTGLQRLFPGDWSFRPTVDVQETSTTLVVTAELPGVDESELDIRLEHDTLVIRGEKREARQETEGRYARSECRYGSFTRSIPLHRKVDREHVKATFRKGVLKVTLRKATPDATATGRIPVKRG
jgi:HSP20 family protein